RMRRLRAGRLSGGRSTAPRGATSTTSARTWAGAETPTPGPEPVGGTKSSVLVMERDQPGPVLDGGVVQGRVAPGSDPASSLRQSPAAASVMEVDASAANGQLRVSAAEQPGAAVVQATPAPEPAAAAPLPVAEPARLLTVPVPAAPAEALAARGSSQPGGLAQLATG